jgi:hypothetical protein
MYGVHVTLERVLSVGDKDGLGLPFTLRHLSLWEECVTALPVLEENLWGAPDAALEEVLGLLRRMAGIPSFRKCGSG